MSEPNSPMTPHESATPAPARAVSPSNPIVSSPNQDRGLDHWLPTIGNAQDILAWLRRRLGGDVWRLEGMNPTALEDCVKAALLKYAGRIPRLWLESIPPGVSVYQPKARGVVGVFRVDFIAPIYSSGGYAAAYQWNAQLTGVGVMPTAGPGLLLPAGDLMRFLMAKKTFMRVASLAPQWLFDAPSNTIHISTPNPSYYACAILILAKTLSEITNASHQDWIRDFALCQARLLLAEIREKHDGSIPTPGGGTIDLKSGALLSRAKSDEEALLTALAGMQWRCPPIWGD